MDPDLKAHLEEMEKRLRSHISQECEKVETKLLTEFHKWASPAEMRARSHAAALRALDIEQEYLSDRIAKLERPEPS